jgi:putative ABC transport system permease protein
MLRALGMTRGQILGLILAEALLLGVLGTALGLGLGVVMARGLVGALTGVIGSQISDIVVPPAGVVTAAGVGLVVTLLAALVPAWNATRISPLQALRVRAQAQEQNWMVRRGWIPGTALVLFALLNVFVIPFRESVAFGISQASIFLLLLGASLAVPAVIPLFQRALAPLLTALFGAEGALGASNIARARGRTAVTVGALMIGLAMVIGQGATSGSFSKNLSDWVETALGADLYVRSPVGMREDTARRLKTIPGVQEVTPVTYMQVKLGERLREPGSVEQLIYIVIDPATYTRVANFQFAGATDPDRALARLAQGDAVLISTTVADKYGLDVGQTIPLVTPRGSPAGGREFYIAGLIVDFTGQGYTVTASRRDLQKYFGVSTVNNYLVRLTPQAKSCGAQADCRGEQAVRNEIEAQFKARHLKTESSGDFRARIMTLAQEAFALLNILSLIGILVAALGVINTLTMNVMERTREIGGLRALGLTMRQTAKLILAEALLVGILGGTFGLVFGYILSRVFLRGVNDLGGFRVEYVLPLNAFASGIVIALVISQLAALYPAWRAARVGIVEAIQHE